MEEQEPDKVTEEQEPDKVMEKHESDNVLEHYADKAIEENDQAVQNGPETRNKEISNKPFPIADQDVELVANVLCSVINGSIDNRMDTEDDNAFNLNESNALEILKWVHFYSVEQSEDEHSKLEQEIECKRQESDIETDKVIAFCQLINTLDNQTIEKCVEMIECSDFKYKSTAEELMVEVVEMCSVCLRCLLFESNAQGDQPNQKEGADPQQPKPTGDPILSTKDKILEPVKTAIKLFRNPMFLFISSSQTVYFMTFAPTVTCIVDYGLDKGLTEKSEYLITALSSGDFAGRLLFGWVTDMEFLALHYYISWSMLFLSITVFCLKFLNSLSALSVGFVVYGLLQGSIAVRYPVILHNYVKDNEESVAMGCIHFMSGLCGFALPSMIGLFRDTLGSYDYMFYSNSAVIGLFSVLWLFQPKLAKWMEQKKNEKCLIQNVNNSVSEEQDRPSTSGERSKFVPDGEP